MNTTINNLSPLPFYEKNTDFNTWDIQKWYSNNQLYPLISDKGVISFFVPFPQEITLKEIKVFKLCSHIGLSTTPSDFIEVNHDAEKKVAGTWLQDFLNGGLSHKDNFLIHQSNFTDILATDGYYYIEIIGDLMGSSVSVYSDIFKVESSFSRTNAKIGNKELWLQWGNNTNVGCGNDVIPYALNYLNDIVLDTNVGFPEYTLDEEGEERMGYFYPTKQVSNKKYKFTFYAPEYLCDCLRLIPLADTIFITDGERGELKPTQFNIDFSWLDGGHYAQVDCEFTTDKVVHIIGNDVKFNSLAK